MKFAIAVILIIIFAPDLFLLPLVLAAMYTTLWPEIYYEEKIVPSTTKVEKEQDNEGLIIFGFIGGIFLTFFIGSWIWHFATN